MLSRYDCEEIRSIWEDQSKYLAWMKIELAFLNHFRNFPVECPKEFLPAWVAEIEKIEEATKHDLASFVQWLEGYLLSRIGLESRFIHFGLTSSDIVDTAFSMMIRDSEAVIGRKTGEVILVLEDLVEKYGRLEMVGRTHGQAAEKITFGSKLRAYQSALHLAGPRHEYYGRLAGSVGDYKYFSPKVEEAVLTDLGLKPCPAMDGQIIHRAVYACYMNDWAVLASVIGKIATDIRLLSHSGVQEMREGFSKDQIGSSSMPQKRNPILCENLCGLARVIRGYQTTAMQDIELWNERDISHSSAERMIFPDAVILLGFMLTRLTSVLKNLYINEDMMERNLRYFASSMEGQDKMLKLIEKGASRKESHHILKNQLIRDWMIE